MLEEKEIKLNDKILQKFGLVAGDGELPVRLAKFAKSKGFDIVAISLSPSNKKLLEKYCLKVYPYGPGELQKVVKYPS